MCRLLDNFIYIYIYLMLATISCRDLLCSYRFVLTEGVGKILYSSIDPIDMLPGAVVMAAGLLKDVS